MQGRSRQGALPARFKMRINCEAAHICSHRTSVSLLLPDDRRREVANDCTGRTDRIFVCEFGFNTGAANTLKRLKKQVRQAQATAFGLRHRLLERSLPTWGQAESGGRLNTRCQSSRSRASLASRAYVSLRCDDSRSRSASAIGAIAGPQFSASVLNLLRSCCEPLPRRALCL